MKKTSRLLIVGVSGRMGGAVAEAASEFDFEVAPGVSRSSGSLEQAKGEDCDVVIDFSLPELTREVIDWCVRYEKPLVSGVTGLKDSDHEALATAGARIPVLWAPNMSLGVAVLTRALRQLGPLEGFDFQIEEVHHRYKKDAPSGTAKALQAALLETLDRPLPPPISIRGGGVFGIHKISAFGDEEILTFEHTALNRRVFARGALRAARWLMGRTPGLYKIDDTL